MFASTKVAFFTRLLFPFLLLLQQEDDWPIQPRDCSSKSPAPLHQVKRITRDSLSVCFAPSKFTLCHLLFPEITLSLSECLCIPNFFHSLVWDIFPIQKISFSWQVPQMCVLFTVVSLCIIFQDIETHDLKRCTSKVHVVICMCGLVFMLFPPYVTAGRWSADSASWWFLQKSCSSAEGEKEDSRWSK